MTTPIAIVQNAMIHVGLEPIESFEDGTPNADSAARLWATHRLTILTHTDWHFARKLQQLSRRAAAPAAKWTYAFAPPPDALRPVMRLTLSADPYAPPLSGSSRSAPIISPTSTRCSPSTRSSSRKRNGRAMCCPSPSTVSRP
ncbi:MAG: hypothetical protein WDM81_13925 [Rhizomicrobium sp.]